jgi:O-antigen ligase
MLVKIESHPKIYTLLFCLIAFIIPFVEATATQFISIAIILLAVFWIISGDFSAKLARLKQRKLVWVFVALYLVNLISLLFSTHQDIAGKILVKKLAILLLPIILGSLPALPAKSGRYILLTFVFSVLLCSLFTYKVDLRLLLDRDDMTHMVGNILLHRIYFGPFCCFAIFILVRFFPGSPLWFRVLAVVAVAYLLFFLYLLYAKMAIIALFAVSGMVTLLYLYNSRTRYYILGGLLAAAISGFFYLSHNPKLQSMIGQVTSMQGFSYQTYDINLVGSFNVRYINWGCSFDILKQDSNWLTGLGLGNVQDKLNACYKDRNPWVLENRMNAHSEYIEEMLRNGLGGLVVLLANILIPLYLGLKKRNFFYLSFLLLFAICSFTESFLSRQAGIIFFAFFNSLLAFHFMNTTEEESAKFI